MLYVLVICAHSGSFCIPWSLGGEIITMSSASACEFRANQQRTDYVSTECRSFNARPGMVANDE